MIDNAIHAIIAESSPIIASGISHVLSSINGLHIHVAELRSPEGLTEMLMSEHPEILVISPTFGGYVNLMETRRTHPELKIVALCAMQLDKTYREFFNESIYYTDDEETISHKIKSLITSDEESAGLDREQLSAREKEIVALVVKGMTNKEIADKLFLSIHTVITHRRNIARKLEIHSATGLTIYAIMNKIVDLSEINIS